MHGVPFTSVNAGFLFHQCVVLVLLDVVDGWQPLRRRADASLDWADLFCGG